MQFHRSYFFFRKIMCYMSLFLHINRRQRTFPCLHNGCTQLTRLAAVSALVKYIFKRLREPSPVSTPVSAWILRISSAGF